MVHIFVFCVAEQKCGAETEKKRKQGSMQKKKFCAFVMDFADFASVCHFPRDEPLAGNVRYDDAHMIDDDKHMETRWCLRKGLGKEGDRLEDSERARARKDS